MARTRYRQAERSDIPVMARIRAEGGWEGCAPEDRMARYLDGQHHPRHALAAPSTARVGASSRLRCGGRGFSVGLHRGAPHATLRVQWRVGVDLCRSGAPADMRRIGAPSPVGGLVCRAEGASDLRRCRFGQCDRATVLCAARRSRAEKILAGLERHPCRDGRSRSDDQPSQSREKAGAPADLGHPRGPEPGESAGEPCCRLRPED